MTSRRSIRQLRNGSTRIAGNPPESDAPRPLAVTPCNGTLTNRSTSWRNYKTRPVRDADPMDSQPGDKSPGYYRVSLRDEGKTAPTKGRTFGPRPRPHRV